MADQQSAVPASEDPNSVTGKPFVEMTGSEKGAFIGKVFVMLVTGGFAFPNIFVE